MNVYTLNLVGQQGLAAAIKEVAYHKSTINPAAWFDIAEDRASGFDTNQATDIEIGSRYTESNRPELITLKREWFDETEID